MTPIIDLQPLFLGRSKRPLIRVSRQNVGWGAVYVATAVLWAAVVFLAAEELMREPGYTYETEVAAYEY